MSRAELNALSVLLVSVPVMLNVVILWVTGWGPIAMVLTGLVLGLPAGVLLVRLRMAYHAERGRQWP
jgi:hypothetical protein